MKKNIEVSLDYLALEKCKDDKERAIKLSEDLERRKAEITQIKKVLEKTRQSVFEGMKDNIKKEIPDLVFAEKDLRSSPICAKFKTDSYSFYVSITKDLGCVLYLDSENLRKGAKLSKNIIKQFKDILSWYTPMYKMFQKFGSNDFNQAYTCYVNVIKKVKEVWPKAINIE